MPKKITIAMVGSTTPVFLIGLSEALKKSEPDLDIQVYGDMTAWGPTLNFKNIVNSLHPVFKSQILQALRKVHFIYSKKTGYATVKFVENKKSPCKETVASSIAKKILRLEAKLLGRRVKKTLAEIDVIHVHGLFWEEVHEVLAYYPIGKPIVVSLWGSDVLRKCKPSLTSAQQILLNKAHVITASGVEFKEIALSKYGRNLAEKFHNTYLPLDPQITKSILDNDRVNAKSLLQKSLNIKSERLIIVVGHNAHPQNQHIPIIKSLNQLPRAKRDRFHIIFPMTYPDNSEEYIETVALAADEAGLYFSIIKGFLTNDQLGQLRLATDILIFAPISDAFSASVSQALMAGSVVLCGSWLPYTARRRAGFQYWELDHLCDIPDTISNLFNAWPKPLDWCAKNKELAECFFDPQKLGKQWLDAYTDAIEIHSRNIRRTL